MIYHFKLGGTDYSLKLERVQPLSGTLDGDDWECELGARVIHAHAHLISPDVLFLVIEGKTFEIKRDSFGNHIRLWIKNRAYSVERFDPRSLNSRSRSLAKGSASKLLASMPGKVLRVLVNEMQEVEAGQSLMVVEAMKMQNEMKSPNKGTVKQLVLEGTRVNAGDVLAIVE